MVCRKGGFTMYPDNEKFIDLHVHSTGSDGTLTPSELIQEARREGICAFALTDHDSVSGIPEALAASEGSGIEVIPGVELSTDYNGTEIHVVGLWIDIYNQELLSQLQSFRDSRDNRNLRMIERLNAYGYRITEMELKKRNPDSVVARPHIARYLVDTGQAPDIKTVFQTLIGNDCPCYVGRSMITPMRAAQLIRDAGGIAILAHPCLYHLPQAEETELIEKMIAGGLDGIEACYSRSTPEQEAHYRALARKYGLLVSGGSDFHGANKPDIRLGWGTGDLRIPYEILDRIRAHLSARRHDRELSE